MSVESRPGFMERTGDLVEKFHYVEAGVLAVLGFGGLAVTALAIGLGTRFVIHKNKPR